jgi:dATP pyrophosphohydrolase
MRAPFQVLVFPYRRTPEGGLEYALFRRADAGFWQGVAGGGESLESSDTGQETPSEAARRETWEEAGIPPGAELLPLSTVESIRVTEFAESAQWGEDVFVIPQHCFGIKADGCDIVLSDEHSEFRWLPYAEADALLRFDGNKTALWELNQRLLGKDPRG